MQRRRPCIYHARISEYEATDFPCECTTPRFQAKSSFPPFCLLPHLGSRCCRGQHRRRCLVGMYGLEEKEGHRRARGSGKERHRTPHYRIWRHVSPAAVLAHVAVVYVVVRAILQIVLRRATGGHAAHHRCPNKCFRRKAIARMSWCLTPGSQMSALHASGSLACAMLCSFLSTSSARSFLASGGWANRLRHFATRETCLQKSGSLCCPNGTSLHPRSCSPPRPPVSKLLLSVSVEMNCMARWIDCVNKNVKAWWQTRYQTRRPSWSSETRHRSV